MIYLFYETQKQMLQPYAQYLKQVIDWTESYEKTFDKNPVTKFLQAKNKLTYEFIRNYEKPEFNIHEVHGKNQTYSVKEKVVLDKTFCQLRFFERTPAVKKAVPLLIVAPLSGHYATLLRDTVKSSIAGFDVYVTDWKNCKDIPVAEGDFGFSDYVLYVQEFITHLKKQYGEVHILAVCQPTVPVLATVAKMAKENSPYQPESMVLMGGPIDTRQSPTEVNNYALKHDLNWFKNNVVYPVPPYFKGGGREVYPGFLQYSGFVAMNFMKHTEAHLDFFNNLLKGADLDAEKHSRFYEEYNAVMDLPAKYYLETLENVFIEQKLAKGTMQINGDKISLEDIRYTRLLTIEGEMDDISGKNQTHSAINLCKNLKDKESQTIAKVGHYGIFAGRTWRETIYPVVEKFIKKT